MSHIDTAYKMGAAQAQYDFDAELSKQAAPLAPTAPPSQNNLGASIPSQQPGRAPLPVVKPSAGLLPARGVGSAVPQ
jgi:hypothetical protein